MKILMLTSGTANSRLTYRIVALGNGLVSRGHSVTLLAPSSDRHSNWTLDQPDRMGEINMVYPYQFKTRSFVINLVPYLISASFEVLRRRADVIYLYKPTPVTIVGLLAKWFKRTPVVLDMDDLGSEVMKLEQQPAAIYRLVAWCERTAARQAAAIVGVSRLLQTEYAARFAAKPVVRIPNGVDVADYVTVAPVAGRKPKIIFFGMLGRPGILAPVISALPRVIAEAGSDAVQLEVLGDGPARAELEELAAKVGVTANVTFRGWTTFAELAKYAAAGDLAMCVTPQSRTTAACSNQKLFQYMALALCPIVSDVGDLALYVEDGKAGAVVPADDAIALSAAIVKLLNDSQARTAIGKRGRKLAETTYAWKTLAGQLDTLLEKVA